MARRIGSVLAMLLVLTAATAQRVELVQTPERPVSMARTEAGNAFFDFGLDAFGQVEVTLACQGDGDTVRLHLGECSRDGRVDRSPGGYRRYRCLTIVTRAGRHTYRPVLPTDGRHRNSEAIQMPAEVGEVTPFRYLEVEGYRGEIGPDDVWRIAVSVPFDDDAAFFRCDNDTLNRVWLLCKHSVRATSFTGYYVDGDRERIPYEADALIGQLCHYATDSRYDVARRTFEHLIQHPTWPTEWILQMVLVAWNDYLYTGSTDLVSRYADDLRAHTLVDLIDPGTGLVTTARGQTPEFLARIHRREAVRDIVDWPHSGMLGLAEGQGGEDDGYVYTDFNTVVNAFHYAAASRLALMLRAIGRKAEAKEMERHCREFRKTFNQAFFDPARGVYTDGVGTDHASLHANMFAVSLGLAEEKDLPRIARHILSRGMACSVYGAQFLLDALYDLHEPEAALRLMTSGSERSWVNMMREGSTITMEAWGNRFKPNQDWNHIWGAAPANIIPFRLMGIRPLSPGFDVVEVRPCPASLGNVECRVPTPKGPIQLSIKSTQPSSGGDGAEMSLTLPEGMKARVWLPVDGGKSHRRVKGFVTHGRTWKL